MMFRASGSGCPLRERYEPQICEDVVTVTLTSNCSGAPISHDGKVNPEDTFSSQ